MTSFQIFPAIDLRDGRCVRLYQGDYGRETVYGDDPVAQAQSFVAEGATVLHVVDLDAARTGEATNRHVIGAVCAASPVPVQVGGGVRHRAAAEALFELGVSRVVIGTAALERPELVEELTAAGRSVAVGLDARGDEVATHGWTERTGRTTAEVAARFADIGVEALVVTEIGRDGTMEGPDTDGLRSLLEATAITVVASGGVGTLAHIEQLAAVEADGSRLGGVIVGRALYERAFTLAQALEVLR
ncbi:MAG: 1-(5-phosphoribosyl)-5-[(5-phosphoribosylamino)methylideneamino]imidazole-4-carboxamide isomerase [Acidimicrobiales bacterium]